MDRDGERRKSTVECEGWTEAQLRIIAHGVMVLGTPVDAATYDPDCDLTAARLVASMLEGEVIRFDPPVPADPAPRMAIDY